jgi:hypothetical protein
MCPRWPHRLRGSPGQHVGPRAGSLPRQDRGPDSRRASRAPPSASTSKSSSFHSPEGRLAEARLRTNVTFVPWPPATERRKLPWITTQRIGWVLGQRAHRATAQCHSGGGYRWVQSARRGGRGRHPLTVEGALGHRHRAKDKRASSTRYAAPSRFNAAWPNTMRTRRRISGSNSA